MKRDRSARKDKVGGKGGRNSSMSKPHDGSAQLTRPQGFVGMKPEHKFHSYVTAATVTMMYFAIQHLLPLINAVAPSYVKATGALLLSMGVYKLLATGLQSAARRMKWVKRHLLGANYVNGTWVGKFRSPSGPYVYTIEHFEQTLSSLKVRGQAYASSGESYAQWTSVSATIDELAGTLTYTYTCDKPDDKSSFQGVCVFQFERADETRGPERIRGYSADLVDGVRTPNFETKISEELLPFGDAFIKAREVA